jgi:hypothetical protein
MRVCINNNRFALVHRRVANRSAELAKILNRPNATEALCFDLIGNVAIFVNIANEVKNL